MDMRRRRVCGEEPTCGYSEVKCLPRKHSLPSHTPDEANKSHGNSIKEPGQEAPGERTTGHGERGGHTVFLMESVTTMAVGDDTDGDAPLGEEVAVGRGGAV